MTIEREESAIPNALRRELLIGGSLLSLAHVLAGRVALGADVG